MTEEQIALIDDLDEMQEEMADHKKWRWVNNIRRARNFIGSTVVEGDTEVEA